MKTVVAFLFAVSFALAARETVWDAALSARKLLHKESILTISSIFKEDVNPGHAGQPFSYFSFMGPANPSLIEYYADCSTDGNPTLLLLDVEITTRNLKHGSPLSLSITTTPPKGIYSVVSLPRMNINGRMTKIDDKNEEEKALNCFLARHPDAHEWTPDLPKPPHKGNWYKFYVDSIYYLGGFGNVSYIGFLPVELYRSVDLKEFTFIEQ